MTNTNIDDLLVRIEELERRLGAGRETNRADIWFLLDRSGSMQMIAADVVRGFDEFFSEQIRQPGEASVTLVQFDDQDPHEVLVDARSIDVIRPIAGRFRPRGNTPLYDAIGLLLDRAERFDGNPADQLVVVYTDGLENASRKWTAQRIFRRISRLREKGWTFVFLGANQDSYATGSALAMAPGNIANFGASPESVAASYRGLSRSTSEWRAKDRLLRARDAEVFWGGVKESEETN
jgi:Mg-chelatase subunit ChlD